MNQYETVIILTPVLSEQQMKDVEAAFVSYGQQRESKQ